MARPAASTSSIFVDEVMPLLPLAAGQSLWSMTRIGRTSHQIGLVFMRSFSSENSPATNRVGGPRKVPGSIRALPALGIAVSDVPGDGCRTQVLLSRSSPRRGKASCTERALRALPEGELSQ